MSESGRQKADRSRSSDQGRRLERDPRRVEEKREMKWRKAEMGSDDVVGWAVEIGMMGGVAAVVDILLKEGEGEPWMQIPPPVRFLLDLEIL